MKNKKVRFALALFVILLLFLIIKTTVNIGITASNLERDARKSQKIDDTWVVSKSVNKNIGAMIFYGDARDHFTFSIYLNPEGLSFGYFFAGGGATGGIEDGISEFTFENKGSALISMNKKKVAQIELDNGIKVTNINIDSTKPFAEVIPSNCGKITLYDVYGNEVSMTDVD